jgi:uncharacterized membrane protein
MQESKSRSIVKTVTWRVVALVSCYIMLASFGMEFWESITTTLVMNVVHVILYYFHERIWNTIGYGRNEV